jgi:hypothetical protein
LIYNDLYSSADKSLCLQRQILRYKKKSLSHVRKGFG